MGLFGRKKQQEIVGGLPGSATVRDWDSDDFWDRHATRDSETVRLTDFGVGNYTFRMDLDVQLDDGRPAYQVSGRYKIPYKAGVAVDVGLAIPVLADPNDPTSLQFDWDAFIAPGGAGHAPTEAETIATVHDGFPDASRKMMIDGWVQATKAGHMTREAFDDAVNGAVSGGLLTAEEADTARLSLG